MINEGNDHRFCKNTISRNLKRLGYKRRTIKKQMVVKEGNRKKWWSGAGQEESGLLRNTGKTGYSVMSLRW